MVRLLHLSDLHFGSNHAFQQEGQPPGRRSLVNAIQKALNDAELQVDGVVLAGDFFDKGNTDERRSARFELEAFKQAFPDMPIMCVPGNHDRSWDEKKDDNPFVDYNDVVARAFGRVAAGDFPELVEIPGASEQRPVAVVLLNSCLVESPVQAGLGMVGVDQRDAMIELLRTTGVSAETHIIVVVLHHHLLPVEDGASPGDPSERPPTTTIDCVSLTRQFAEVGVTLALHGHQHTPAVQRYERLEWDLPSLYIGSTGTAGFRDDSTRHFFVWEIEDDTLVAKFFSQGANRQEFTLTRSLTLPIETPPTA